MKGTGRLRCPHNAFAANVRYADIHDANLSFFSPQPYFIGAFFFPQQLFQLAWLYRLYKLDPRKPIERNELDQIVDFVPYYSIGNLCIAGQYFLGVLSHKHDENIADIPGQHG